MKLFILSAIFVIVNSIRAIWIRHDGTRNVLYDNFMSNPLMGRIITTVSEISFVVLIILIMKQIITRGNHNKRLNIPLNIIFIIIFIAEIFCWSGCLSKNQLWHVLEESSWAISSIILTVVMVIIKINEKNTHIQNFLIIGIILSIIYQIFMFTVDIPMYFKRTMIRKTKENSKNINLYERFIDMSKYQVSKKYEDWVQEMPWMTGYFTVGSWISIALIMWYQSNRKLF